MEANEILNNEELIDNVVETVELPETNNIAAKVVIGIGVLAAAGATALLYKKHKNKAIEDGDCEKRRFTLLKNKNEDPVDTDSDSYETEEK